MQITVSGDAVTEVAGRIFIVTESFEVHPCAVVAMITFLAVAEVHCPANPEQSHQEADEGVNTVMETVLVCLLCHDSEHDRREEREQEGRLEMGEIHLRH